MTFRFECSDYVVYYLPLSFFHYDKYIIINARSAVSVFVRNSYSIVILNDHDDVEDLNKYSADEGEIYKYMVRLVITFDR